MITLGKVLGAICKTRSLSGYNLHMHVFHFYHPIEVRYGDLDPQGHLNNAKYFTFIEQARISYWKHLELWDGGSFINIGIILAEERMTFKAPILWGQPIRVGVSVTRLGHKSLDIIYTIEDTKTNFQHASGSTVQVAYDYHTATTIPIPDEWRKIITGFEKLE